MSRMDETAWEVRRPDLLLSQVGVLHPFERPRTYLTRVDGPYEHQALVGTTVLWDEPPAGELERTRIMEEALGRLGFCRMSDRDYLSWPLAVPIVVRPGSAWPGWDESEAFLGLRYGSNWVDARQGDVLTVTAQGWYSHLDGLWGTTPRARWSTGPADRPPAVLTIPQAGECLPCFLRRAVNRRGCGGRLSLTSEWQWAQRRRGIRTGGLTAYLKRHGGYCDCEVLTNVYPDDQQDPSGRCPHPLRRW